MSSWNIKISAQIGAGMVGIANDRMIMHYLGETRMVFFPIFDFVIFQPVPIAYCLLPSACPVPRCFQATAWMLPFLAVLLVQRLVFTKTRSLNTKHSRQIP
jgi:hypothetical protein